jgi:catechol 2,3-dioxygenase-like lactoylglutathione lyase family enzyme
MPVLHLSRVLEAKPASQPDGATVEGMAVQLNHTIVESRDKAESARFLAAILGVPEPTPYGSFLAVQAANDVTLDFRDAAGPITSQHYAFLVSEEEFDGILGRIKERNLPYWADPGHHQPDRINHNDGGRGVYFDDPNGHILEAITRPYGSGG